MLLILVGPHSACGDSEVQENTDPESTSGEDPTLITCEDGATCVPTLCFDGRCLDGSKDDDGDGLDNETEVTIGTDPTDVDTDGDGLVDSYEVDNVLAPLDTDGDGVIDALESDKSDADCDNISDQQDPTDDSDSSQRGGSAATPCQVDKDSDGVPDEEDCEPDDSAIGTSCPEPVPCFTNVCQPGVGCSTEPIACDDGDNCTVDSCEQKTGTCVFTEIACDDDPCTWDVCAPATGECLTVKKDCNDGVPCTTEDHCEAGTGKCIGTPKNCDDAQPCTIDVCLPNSGLCQSTPIVCDDADACTIDLCDPLNGECLHQGGKCNDDSLCSVDTCDPLTGDCSYTDVTCEDEDECTIDLCDPDTGTCIHEPKTCDDDSLCTTTVCDPTTGWCDHPEIDCNDLDACTDDSCDESTGQCINEPITCHDILLCTEDLCLPSVGCVFEPTACDDGDTCTTGSCSEDDGACHFTPVVCDDENPCTQDTCNGSFAGACTYEPIECEDDEPCTSDSCDTDTGACVHTAIPPGTLTFGPTTDSPTGLGLWNAVEAATEVAATGHVVPTCDNAPAPFYLASSEYDLLDPLSLGAAVTTATNGLEDFQTKLDAMSLDLQDLTLHLGVSDLGDDVEGADWTFDPETQTEVRHYQAAHIELWLDGNPLVATSPDSLTVTVDHSACDALPRPASLETDWTYALNVTNSTDETVQAAAQSLLYALGVPAKVRLSLTLTNSQVATIEGAGRSGHLVGGVTGTLSGVACGAP